MAILIQQLLCVQRIPWVRLADLWKQEIWVSTIANAGQGHQNDLDSSGAFSALRGGIGMAL